MANQEHVDILRQGVGEWNTWREQHPNIYPDLSYAELSNFNLSNFNLDDADLSDAQINDADLSDAHLCRAYLSDTNLSGTNLVDAHLIDTDFSYTDLSHANLSRANLSRAILTQANLGGTRLRVADLNRADLKHAHLSAADFSYAHLYHANLSDTDLSDAHLRDADLSYADLNRADLRNADLRNADLDADLSHVVLWETVLGNVNLQTVKGLETVRHFGPSTIGTDTLERSQGDIPEVFLRGVGLSDTFIEYAHALFQEPIQYYTCFISYSSKDEAFAKRLHSDLQSEGVRCWFAPKDMDIGDKIRHRINESIHVYDKLLLVLSKHSHCKHMGCT